MENSNFAFSIAVSICSLSNPWMQSYKWVFNCVGVSIPNSHLAQEAIILQEEEDYSQVEVSETGSNKEQRKGKFVS